jgi:hypothetical protein
VPFLLEHSDEINVAAQKAEREWLSSLGLPPQDETGDQGGETQDRVLLRHSDELSS